MGLEKLFRFLTVTVCLIFFLSFILALLNLFYPIIILILAGLAISFIFIRKKTKENKTLKASLNSWEFTVLIIIAIFCLYIFIFFNPSILGGRDAGSMVEAAIKLSQNHQQQFKPPSLAVFDNKDSNELALNYPGFIITPKNQLKTQFNLGYVSYLAFWYSLFQEKGLKFANLPGLILGLVSIFLIIKSISRNNALAVASLPLIFLNFPFIWFTRQNFSETMAFAFLFTAIFYLIKQNQSSKKSSQNIFFILACLFCFSTIRIEGILISMIALAIISASYLGKKHAPGLNPQKLTALILILISFFILYSLSIVPFYKKIAKDLIDYKQDNHALSYQPLNIKENLETTSYLFSVFYYYGLLAITLVGLLKISAMLLPGIKNILRWLKKPLSQKNLKKNIASQITPAAIPLIIAAPFLVYFIKPMISLDHPWLLRRFMFAVIPLLTIYAVIFIYELPRKKTLSFIIIALLTLFPLCVFFDFGFIKTNPAIKNDLKTISAHFSNNSLVLVDKSTAFNDWSLICSPLRSLYQINAVYIYNSQDIEKIPKNHYDNIYLLISPKQAEKYKNFIDPLSPAQTFYLHYQDLHIVPFSKNNYPRDIQLPPLLDQEKPINAYKIKNPETL
ncbi:MAG: hypothetical protein ABIC19_04415 [Patescibacteria group bacterium]